MRLEGRGGNDNLYKIYRCPQDHFVMNMATLFRCLSHKEETQRGGVVDGGLCIHFRCGGGEKQTKMVVVAVFLIFTIFPVEHLGGGV